MNKVADLVDIYIRTDSKDALVTVSKAYQSITAASYHAGQDDESDVVISMIEETQDLIGKIEDTVYNCITDINQLDQQAASALEVLENLADDFDLKLFIIKSKQVQDVGAWLVGMDIKSSITKLAEDKYSVFVPTDRQLLFKMRWCDDIIVIK